MNSFQLFVLLLTVQMFYALGVTLLVPYMPNAANNQVVMFTNSNNTLSFDTLSDSVSSGITGQTNLPLLDLGALIFYSSATIISLMVNFFTAIPQMVTLLESAFFLFFPIDATLSFNIRALTFSIITILYYMVIFSFISSTRTAGRVIG